MLASNLRAHNTFEKIQCDPGRVPGAGGPPQRTRQVGGGTVSEQVQYVVSQMASILIEETWEGDEGVVLNIGQERPWWET